MTLFTLLSGVIAFQFISGFLLVIKLVSLFPFDSIMAAIAILLGKFTFKEVNIVLGMTGLTGFI